MSNSFLALRQAIGAKFAGILQANGYRTDIGADVKYDAAQTEAEDPPRAAVLTQGFARRELAIGAHERVIDAVVLVTIGASYSNAQQIAEDALEDALQALPNPVELELSPRSRVRFEITGGEILRRPEGMACIAAAVNISAKLTERTR